MKLIYHPDESLDKKVNEVDLLNPGFDPKELKKEMVQNSVNRLMSPAAHRL